MKTWFLIMFLFVAFNQAHAQSERYFCTEKEKCEIILKNGNPWRVLTVLASFKDEDTTFQIISSSGFLFNANETNHDSTNVDSLLLDLLTWKKSFELTDSLKKSFFVESENNKKFIRKLRKRSTDDILLTYFDENSMLRYDKKDIAKYYYALIIVLWERNILLSYDCEGGMLIIDWQLMSLPHTNWKILE